MSATSAVGGSWSPATAILRQVVGEGHASRRCTPPRPAHLAPARVGGGQRLVVQRLIRPVGTVVAGAGVIVALVIAAVLVGPRLLPYQTYSVLSGSMEPTIPVGSVIVLLPVSAQEIEVGEVITFNRPDRPGLLVTHRVVRIEAGATGRFLVTRGDANGADDAWRIPVAGQGWRQVLSVPHLGRLLASFHAPWVRLVLVVLPAAFLGLQQVVRVWRPATAAPCRLDPATNG